MFKLLVMLSFLIAQNKLMAADSITQISLPGGAPGKVRAYGISPDGTTVAIQVYSGTAPLASIEVGDGGLLGNGYKWTQTSGLVAISGGSPVDVSNSLTSNMVGSLGDPIRKPMRYNSAIPIWSPISVPAQFNNIINEGLGISGDGRVLTGQMITNSTLGNLTKAFYTQNNLTPVFLPELPGLPQFGTRRSQAWSASDTGIYIVGTSPSVLQPQAFKGEPVIWTSMSDPLTPGNTFAVQSLGDVAGGEVWGVARRINPAGNVIVGWGTDGGTSTDGNHIAVRWEDISNDADYDDTDERTTLGRLQVITSEDTDSYAYGVSGDGKIVVGASCSGFHNSEVCHAFIWTHKFKMRLLKDVFPNIDFQNWSLHSARDISTDGSRIVGYGSVGGNDPNSALSEDSWVIEVLDFDNDGVHNSTDNCPYISNPNQSDVGGVGATTLADGIGDACQCGDVTGDGKVTPADATVITRALLVPPTATMTKPELCDVAGSTACTSADAVIITRALLVPPTAKINQKCMPATPQF